MARLHGQSDDDTPLVILPGLLCDARMFAGQVADLRAEVIGGFYGGADSIGEMARYALERMPPRCALLGHSMGGRVAIEIWRRAPERVARLALADSGVHPVAAGEADKRLALRDLGRAEGAEALVDAWLPPMLAAARRGDHALGYLREMTLSAGMAVFEPQTRALLGRPDAETVLPTIACPTFVIVGGEDAWSPPAQQRAIAAAIPGAQLRVIAGAGHMAPAEDVAGFNAVLREWLGWDAERAAL